MQVNFGKLNRTTILFANNFFRLLLKPTVKILNATLETAEVFGMVKSKLKAAGTPLPINDLWIAAHAIETGSIVVTFDKHFNEVSGLRLWDQAGKLEIRD